MFHKYFFARHRYLTDRAKIGTGQVACPLLPQACQQSSVLFNGCSWTKVEVEPVGLQIDILTTAVRTAQLGRNAC